MNSLLPAASVIKKINDALDLLDKKELSVLREPRTILNFKWFMNFDYRLKCKRCVNGIQVKPPPEDSDCNSDLSQWHHCNTKKNVEDLALKSSWDAGVTFVYHHKSHDQIKVV